MLFDICCAGLPHMRVYRAALASRTARAHVRNCKRRGKGLTNPGTIASKSTPPHTQATCSYLGSGWDLNLRPQYWRKRTSVFDYSPILLWKLGKVSYLNLSLRGWLVQLTCVCAGLWHGCENDRAIEWEVFWSAQDIVNEVSRLF